MTSQTPARLALGNAYTVELRPTVYDAVSRTFVPWTGATIKAGVYASEVTPPSTAPLVEITLAESPAGVYRGDFSGTALVVALSSFVGRPVYVIVTADAEFSHVTRVHVVNTSTNRE